MNTDAHNTFENLQLDSLKPWYQFSTTKGRFLQKYFGPLKQTSVPDLLS